MDWKVWVAPISSILAVVVTNWLATHRFERERKHRKADELRDLYVKWIAGTRAWLNYTANGGGSSAPTDDLMRLRLQIEFLDEDPNAPILMTAVQDALPDPGTSDHADLEEIAADGSDWDWPPYENAMKALRDHLKDRKR